MLISESSDVVAGRRAASWPYVTAVATAITLVVYLWVWGQRYGLDLEIYRDSVSSWVSGRNPYLLTFTRSGLSFTYPPFALLALSPLTWAPFLVTQWLLWAANLAAAELRSRGCCCHSRFWPRLAAGSTCQAKLIRLTLRYDRAADCGRAVPVGRAAGHLGQRASETQPTRPSAVSSHLISESSRDSSAAPARARPSS